MSVSFVYLKSAREMPVSLKCFAVMDAICASPFFLARQIPPAQISPPFKMMMGLIFRSPAEKAREDARIHFMVGDLSYLEIGGRIVMVMQMMSLPASRAGRNASI